MVTKDDRRRKIARRGAAVAAAILCCVAQSTDGVGQVIPQAATSLNPYNDELLRMSPAAQAAKLASFLSFGCIGTRPFLMGITKEGAARGYAYWSIECAGGQSFMVQIAPDGQGAALDCREVKKNGQGRECYKTF